MVSFLVISENSKKAEAWIKNIISHYQISKFDVTFVEKDGTEKDTIGIEQVRFIQKKLSLKPLAGAIKAVIIKNADSLTIEAQNALLKTLEEPPGDTIIILTANKTEALLPTILSRCTIINLGFEIPALSPDETSQYQSLIQSLQEWEIGERLKKAETLAKDKQEAIIFLEKMILTGRTELLIKLYSSSEESRDGGTTSREVIPTRSSRLTSFARTINYYHSLLISLQQTHKILSTTNVNPRFALENMFLSIFN